MEFFLNAVINGVFALRISELHSLSHAVCVTAPPEGEPRILQPYVFLHTASPPAQAGGLFLLWRGCTNFNTHPAEPGTPLDYFPVSFTKPEQKSNKICKYLRKAQAHSVAQQLTLDKFEKKLYSSQAV